MDYKFGDSNITPTDVDVLCGLHVTNNGAVYFTQRGTHFLCIESKRAVDKLTWGQQTLAQMLARQPQWTVWFLIHDDSNSYPIDVFELNSSGALRRKENASRATVQALIDEWYIRANRTRLPSLPAFELSPKAVCFHCDPTWRPVSGYSKEIGKCDCDACIPNNGNCIVCRGPRRAKT